MPSAGHLLRDAARVAGALRVVHRTRVVIAGGGVAGLAAARALRQRGIEDFALLELEDTAGGNSRGSAHRRHRLPAGRALPAGAGRRGASRCRTCWRSWACAGASPAAGPTTSATCATARRSGCSSSGAWQEGLLPVQGVGAATLAQYQRFARLVARGAESRPVHDSSCKSARQRRIHARWHAITFHSVAGPTTACATAHLRWYLDYCCRDDYGAGLATVSAWAGIHYFASRHGFQAPGEDAGERDGGADLARRQCLADAAGWREPLGERLRTGRVVLRIAQARQGVEVDAFNTATRQRGALAGAALHRGACRCSSRRGWWNRRPRLCGRPRRRMRYAPWAVANLHLREPLQDRPGAAPAWDNVVYGAAGLGYVDARHQA